MVWFHMSKMRCVPLWVLGTVLLLGQACLSGQDLSWVAYARVDGGAEQYVRQVERVDALMAFPDEKEYRPGQYANPEYAYSCFLFADEAGALFRVWLFREQGLSPWLETHEVVYSGIGEWTLLIERGEYEDAIRPLLADWDRRFTGAEVDDFIVATGAEYQDWVQSQGGLHDVVLPKLGMPGLLPLLERVQSLKLSQASMASGELTVDAVAIPGSRLYHLLDSQRRPPMASLQWFEDDFTTLVCLAPDMRRVYGFAREALANVDDFMPPGVIGLGEYLDELNERYLSRWDGPLLIWSDDAGMGRGEHSFWIAGKYRKSDRESLLDWLEAVPDSGFWQSWSDFCSVQGIRSSYEVKRRTLSVGGYDVASVEVLVPDGVASRSLVWYLVVTEAGILVSDSQALLSNFLFAYRADRPPNDNLSDGWFAGRAGNRAFLAWTQRSSHGAPVVDHQAGIADGGVEGLVIPDRWLFGWMETVGISEED